MTDNTSLVRSSRIQWSTQLPLVAILRGLDPSEAVAIGRALYETGFRTLEVPLNRPGALDCIARLVQDLPADALIGGGTMLCRQDVDAVHAAGGKLMVAPNCDPEVIRHAANLGLVCVPGVATPTEAFSALQAGAHALKIFPAEMVGQGGLKAFKSVLPSNCELWPVGGISPDSMAGWMKAGATGFGIGGQLFKPGTTVTELTNCAKRYVEAFQLIPANG